MTLPVERKEEEELLNNFKLLESSLKNSLVGKMVKLRIEQYTFIKLSLGFTWTEYDKLKRYLTTCMKAINEIYG